ncbi:MAG: hypothetical protein RRY73_05020 [Alistipes sp.]
MKAKNIFYLFSFLAAALFMGSCSDDVTRDPSPEVNPNCMQVFFPTSNQSTFELVPTDPTELTVTVNRVKTEEAAIVPVMVTTNTDNIFTNIPETVQFTAGQASTSFTVRFDQSKEAIDYRLSVTLLGENVDPYAVLDGSVSYTADVIRIKWVAEGAGLGHGIFNYKGYITGKSENILERGEGTNMYRMKGWGIEGTTFKFNLKQGETTKFDVPAQYAANDERYGAVTVTGKGEFDGEYTYTFTNEYTVAAGSFGEDKETFVLDHEVDPSTLTVEMAVDPAITEATVSTTPSDATIPYYYDVLPKAKFDASTLAAEMKALFKQVADQNKVTVEQLLAQVLTVGAHRAKFSKLTPDSPYVIFAYAVDPKTGDGLSEFSTKEFSTLPAGEAGAEYEKYLGTWTLTSAKTFADKGPITYNVTLAEKVPNVSFTMTGWSVNPDFVADPEMGVTVNFDAATNGISIANQQDVGSAGPGETGEDVRIILGAYIKHKDKMTVVTGDYPAVTGVLNATGGIDLTLYSGTLSDESSFQVIGMDYVGVDSQYIYTFSWEDADGNKIKPDYGVGPYTMVKNANSGSAGEKLHLQRLHGVQRNFFAMSFSSVSKALRAR